MALSSIKSWVLKTKEKFSSHASTLGKKTSRSARRYLRQPLTRKQKRNLIGVVVFLIITITLGGYLWHPVKQFVTDPTQFQALAQRDPLLAAITFIGIMVLQIIIAIIPGEPVQLAAGYAFGPLLGTLLSLLGAVIGSTIVFLLVKKYGHVIVDVFFSKKQLENISFIHDAKRLNTLIFILMFIPGTPKDLISYVIGLTPMKLKTWLLISTPARIPGILASTYAGHSFGSGNLTVTLIIAAIAAVFAILGIIYYGFLTKQARKKRDMERMIAHYRSVQTQSENRAQNNVTHNTPHILNYDQDKKC